MVELEPPPPTQSLRRLVFGLLSAGLTVLSLWVLAPFLAPITWAAILAYVSWPAFRVLRRLFGRSATAPALVMMLLVTCVLLLPLLWLLFLLRDELMSAFKPLTTSLTTAAHVAADRVGRIPWLGAMVQQELNRYLADPAVLGRESMTLLQSWIGTVAGVLGELGRNAVKVLLTLLILFFFYRDGDTIACELQQAAKRLFGGVGYIRYVQAAGKITQAVFFGFIVSAAAQGLIAAIGYRLAGLTAPVLLGALTAVASVIPLVGTALVWLPIGIGLLVAGAWGKGLLLLAWGALLVNPADNLLRLLLVSNAARLPLLLVALGVIGGLSAFGLVGLFAGPVLLGLALQLWRDYTSGAFVSSPRGETVGVTSDK